MDKSKTLQPISARDLGRKVAEVLDRVEMEREALLVTRNGRPVATLAPINHRMDPQERIVAVLSPIQERILQHAASRAPQATASFEGLGDFQEVRNGLSGLESDGLLERGFAGYGITQQGALVAAVLEGRSKP